MTAKRPVFKKDCGANYLIVPRPEYGRHQRPGGGRFYGHQELLRDQHGVDRQLDLQAALQVERHPPHRLQVERGPADGSPSWNPEVNR